jgi:Domain of unknown function (DUF4160)
MLSAKAKTLIKCNPSLYASDLCYAFDTEYEGKRAMPTIAWFYGIAIRMYIRDHPPPHFHAVYGEHEAFIAIETGDAMKVGYRKWLRVLSRNGR